MTHGNFCTGMGGWDLAADALGWETVMQCERDPFCQAILKYYWPRAYLYPDLVTADFTPFAGKIDVLTLSTPCQPFSNAGQQLGTADPRHLWPYGYHGIQQIKPRWVVFEQVFGFFSWSKGLVFQQVCTDLENLGYEVLPTILPASGVNAPHRRYRVLIVAYRHDWGRQEYELRPGQEGAEAPGDATISNAQSERLQNGSLEGLQQFDGGAPTDADGQRFGTSDNGRTARQPESLRNLNSNTERAGLSRTECARQFGSEPGYWDNWPTTEPLFCSGNDGLSDRLDLEALSKTRTKKGRFNPVSYWRNESIKAAGNAVVPQLMLQILKTIQDYETEN